MKVVDVAPHCFDVGAVVKHPGTVDARFQQLLDPAKEQRARQTVDALISVTIEGIERAKIAFCRRYICVANASTDKQKFF